MSQLFSSDKVTTRIPSVIPDVTVQTTPSSGGTIGIVSIVGEAAGGAPFGEENIEENFFTVDQIDRIQAKYESGPIVDAARALSAPANDVNIPGSVSRIYVVKTNSSLQAALNILTAAPSSYGDYEALNHGIKGNQIAVTSIDVQAETSPRITGTDLSFGPATAATATLDLTTDIILTSVAVGEARNTETFTLQVLAAAANPTDTILADFTGTAAAIICTITPNDGSNNGATPVDLTTAELAELINTGAVAGKTVTITDASTLRALQTATGGDATVLADAGEGDGEVATFAGGDDSDGAAFDSLAFGVRLNGGAVTSITTSASENDHDTIAELAAEISAQLPSGMTSVAVGNGLQFIVDTDADPNSKGWGKAFELIDSSPAGDLATLGHAEGLTSSSTEVQNETTVTRTSTGTNESFIAGGDIGLNVGYDGTTATFSISALGVLTTTVVGGSGASQSINLSEFSTISELADFINSLPGYTSSAGSTASQLAASSLDQVTTVGIAVTNPALRAGRIKFDAFDYSRRANESTVVSFTSAADVGIPAQFAAASAKQFLSGGIKGATTAAAATAGIDELEKIKTNFVVPLFSRDATNDITDELTDAASTYSIDAIHAATRSHILRMSTIKLRRFRNGFVAIDDTFTASKDAARALASHRMTLAFQKTKGLDSQSQIATFGAWHTATIAAGMTAAGLQRSITHKFANVSGFVDPSGFASGSLGDQESALEAGLLIMDQDSGAFRFVSDQTSYSFDNNFFFNSGQAVYTADILADDLANALDRAFVGGSTADITAQSVVTFVQAKMNEYLRRRLISTSDDAVAGFKGLRVTLNGPVLEVSVEVKLSTTIFFVPLNIEISQVTQSAEG